MGNSGDSGRFKMMLNYTDTTWPTMQWLNLSTTMEFWHHENQTEWNTTLQQNITLFYSGNLTRKGQSFPGLSMTSSCLVYRVFMSVGISVPLIIVGLFGNVLSSVVLLRQRRSALNASMNFLLVFLGILDSFLLVSVFFLKAVPSLCGLGYWPQYMPFYRSYLLTYLLPVSSSVLAANEYLVVLIAFQRFLHVCHSKLARKYCTLRLTRIQALVVFLFGFIYSIPRFMEFELVNNPRTGRKARVPTDLMKNNKYKVGYTIVSSYIMIYVIPLTILVMLTYKLFKVVRGARKKHAQLVSSGDTAKARKNDDEVTVSLVAVVCVFCFTQLHNPVRRTLELLIPYTERGCPSFMFYYVEVNTLLNVLNYSVNFLLYFLFNKRFRGQLRQLLCKRNAVGVDTTHGMSGTSNKTQSTAVTRNNLTVRTSHNVFQNPGYFANNVDT